jgi:heme oxygenase
MGPVRAHLARVTAEIHESLHAAAPFARIAQGTIGRDGYGRLLAMLHRYHGGMAGLCMAGAQALDASFLAQAHHARIARLEEDLAFLGVTPMAVQPEPARDAGFSIGCLYTVLGSTLGGKVISRQLENLLPDGQGRGFFTGGPDDAAHWRLFCDRLETCAHAPAVLEAGACHAFGRFAAHLENPLSQPPRPAPAAVI